MTSNKIKFRSIEELKDNTLSEKLANEFSEPIPVEDFVGDNKLMNEGTSSRRDFLKILGFSTAAVTLASCEAPITKSIPYLVNPDNGIVPAIPGVPNYYASTFFSGSDFANVLVKTREGRPIKIEPNKEDVFFGDANARAQASVLSLYDNDKVKEPKLNSEGGFVSTSWGELDKRTVQALNKAQQEGKKIVILMPSYPSPTTEKIIEDFKSKYANTEVVVQDLLSDSVALNASEEVFGRRVLPMYDLSKAKLVVSFQADFLNNWNGGHMDVGYAKAKTPGKDMLKHIQVESNMSMTGANADVRIPLKPTDVNKLLAEVYKALDGNSTDKNAISISKELKSVGGKSVVLVDGNEDAYVLGHLINQKLNSEVVLKDQVLYTRNSDDAKLSKFIEDANASKVGVVINFNTNPVYSSSIKNIEKAFSKVDFSVAIAEKENETNSLFSAIAPMANWLESWGDYRLSTKVYGLSQPTIQKVFNTRSFQDSLLKWIGSEETHYDALKKNWESTILPKLGYSFNQALFNGVNVTSETDSLSYVSGNAAVHVAKLLTDKASEIELQLYTKTSVGDGSQANNPWLQELPDPITRTSWDNYITINPVDAEKLGIENKFDGKMSIDGSLINLTVGGVELTNVPAFIQPGQAVGSIGLALGYGQKGSGKVAETGINAYKLLKGGLKSQKNVAISTTGEWHEFACIQMQNTLMGRYEIAREVSNFDYINKDSKEWNEPLAMHSYTKEMPIGKVDLWDEHDSSDGPKFNLSIDMNSCTGCGACVIACQAENNVPVVGKDEIRRSRDMYWLRIDRYYSADEKITLQDSLTDGLNEKQQYEKLINPATENPDVIFQPVMCQHCNHAPCETVCPVAATSHGKQGQNHMAYNRCVGTRYCANNCPYKVRRFNWFNYALNDKFDYHMNNDLGRMVLNPDVVTRSRGVMEKCSMCIQMTQKTILEAKKEGRRVKDGEFQTACSEACSTGAIQFGDINDKSSKINELLNDKRKYVLLEDIGTKPNVFYHYKVRNRK
ncbi:MAG: TAT-variant-translocated molybdopterin oxidoreductase [Flavobacteriales bacterium]|nr:TAT-variant-translocated molybdopterin oxidoreductase [Flavobacteriales bacterium]